jgi:hypothetical protein
MLQTGQRGGQRRKKLRKEKRSLTDKEKCQISAWCTTAGKKKERELIAGKRKSREEREW